MIYERMCEEALKEPGVEIPEDVNVEVFQVSKKTIPFILPKEMSEMGSLTDEELGQVVGGQGGMSDQSSIIKEGLCYMCG